MQLYFYWKRNGEAGQVFYKNYVEKCMTKSPAKSLQLSNKFVMGCVYFADWTEIFCGRSVISLMILHRGLGV